MSRCSRAMPQKRPDRADYIARRAPPSSVGRRGLVMSKSRLNRANVFRLAFTAMIGTTVMVASIPAQAQEEEDNGLDIQIIRRVLSAVGLRDDKPPIDYRERSPLVVPPTTSLPPPMSGNVAAPNWPVDPEIQEQ